MNTTLSGSSLAACNPLATKAVDRSDRLDPPSTLPFDPLDPPRPPRPTPLDPLDPPPSDRQTPNATRQRAKDRDMPDENCKPKDRNEVVYHILDRQCRSRMYACNWAYLNGRLSFSNYDRATRDISAWSGDAYDVAVAQQGDMHLSFDKTIPARRR